MLEGDRTQRDRVDYKEWLYWSANIAICITFLGGIVVASYAGLVGAGAVVLSGFCSPDSSIRGCARLVSSTMVVVVISYIVGCILALPVAVVVAWCFSSNDSWKGSFHTSPILGPGR
jgi:hypothetical protein